MPVAIIHFKHCVVTIDSDRRRVETAYEDGTVAVGVPHDTDSYRQTARDLGYGDDTWRMTVHHEVFHSAIAELLGEHHSGSLWAQAHKPPDFEFDTSKMPRKGKIEEERLFAVQRILSTMDTVC